MNPSGEKILCIEDDRETAGLIEEELAEQGYRIRLASDGDQGLAAILTFEPNLVLADIVLPVLSGFDILERLASAEPRYANVPVVFVTAITDADVRQKARQLGVQDFVTKPIDFETLLAIIKAGLAGNARLNNRPKALPWIGRIELSATAS